MGFFLSSLAGAADPAWWSQGSPRPVKTSGNEPLAVANIGQAKYLAKCAYDALHLHNPVVAQALLPDLVGPSKAIETWDPPAPGTPAAIEQYSPLLLGQLKAIARPFYNHLNTASSPWVLSQIQLNHNQQAVEETHYWQISGNSHYTPNGYYPWNPATPAAANNAPVTIGQLKAIFALRFETFLAQDTDLDGIPDGLELTLISRVLYDAFGNEYLEFFNPADADTDNNGIPDGNEDYDRDGLTTLEEIALGTDPNKSDTDSDGVNDYNENALGTSPLNADQWYNAQGIARDSDGDELSDIFEIAYGTNPFDPDTNGNGMLDGPELDAGGTPAEAGDPPPILPPIVIEEPPADPEVIEPPPLTPGDHEILVESKEVNFPKHGHETFLPLDPCKRYLRMDSYQSFRGGCPESGPLYVTGSRSDVIDPLEGSSTQTGDWYVNTGDTPDSPLRASGTLILEAYDDPPNATEDCAGEARYTSVLSSENTTAMMLTNGKARLEAFEGGEALLPGTPLAYRNVHDNELHFDYQRTQFKLKWKEGVTAEQRHPLTYLLVFTPEDDPSTPEVEKPEVIETIQWNGQTSESELYVVDPDLKRPGKDGNYALVPIEITVAFGSGPDNPEEGNDANSQDVLEEYLGAIEGGRSGDYWAVKGKDQQGNDKIWGVEIVTDQDKLNSALGAEGRFVVFDGHANYGLGPEFPIIDPVEGIISPSKIEEFTNYGVGYTGIPRDYRKTGQLDAEGNPIGHLEVGDDEIPEAPINYLPAPLVVERFPNSSQVGVTPPLNVFNKMGQGFGTWHYIADDTLEDEEEPEMLMVNAPDTDLPQDLNYKLFFYNACYSGRSYIESFKQQGEFIYTNNYCWVYSGTTVFVKGVIEGKNSTELLPLLNLYDVHGGEVDEVIYELESF